MKIKVLEAKHQEEKLKMQQRHDADVEKVRIKTEVVNTLTAAATFCGWHNLNFSSLCVRIDLIDGCHYFLDF